MSILKRLFLSQRNRAIGALLAACFLLLAYAAQHYHAQADITQNARNTLSKAALDALRQLPGPLAVTAYATPQDPQLGDVRKLIGDFVEPYRRAKPDLSLKFIDPRARPQLAAAAGIHLNGEMVLSYGRRSEHVTVLNEPAFVNALLRLWRSGERLVLNLEGHGERKLNGIANHDLGDFGRQLEERGFRLGSVNLAIAQEVPANAHVLVIASPQTDLTPAEVQKIRRHLEKGGNLLWLLDQEPLHGMQPVAELLGLILTPGIAVDPAAAQRNISPAMTTAAAYGEHSVTHDFNLNTLFPFARHIGVSDGSGWKAAPLAETSQRGWIETGSLEGKIAFDAARDIAGPATVAVALERTQDDKNQRVVVVGSGHFLSNTYLGNGGNLDLGINMVNWLSGEERFAAVQPRPVVDGNLVFGKAALTAITFAFLVILPAGFALAGGIVWWRRRL